MSRGISDESPAHVFLVELHGIEWESERVFISDHHNAILSSAQTLNLIFSYLLIKSSYFLAVNS